MIVGGREFNEDRASVERKMRGIEPDDIRAYYVVVNGVKYPPKQVLAVTTEWPRTSFTTMEAQRVLQKIGFPSTGVDGSRSVESLRSSQPVLEREDDPLPQARIVALEAGLATAMEAIAGLAARVRALEGGAAVL